MCGRCLKRNPAETLVQKAEEMQQKCKMWHLCGMALETCVYQQRNATPQTSTLVPTTGNPILRLSKVERRGWNLATNNQSLVDYTRKRQ